MRLLACLIAASLASCVVTRNVQDPTVTLQTAGGAELGVSTARGVVVLGHTAQSGEVDRIVWYGDGPSIEASVIEPLGDGLYLAQGEILLPTVDIAFPKIGPDDVVVARGRRGAEVWEIPLYHIEDPRITGGLAFRAAQALPTDADQVGAGVFWEHPDTGRRYFIGIVTGTVDVDGDRYVTAIGGQGLWRLVAHRRDSFEEGRFIYRDDIL
jgi:hypothetical protein